MAKGTWRRQIHQSAIETLSKCGIQFENIYIIGKRRRPKSFLISGSALDTGVSLDLNHKITTEELEKEEVVLDAVRDSVQKADKVDLEPEDDEKGKSIEQIIGAAKDKAVRLSKAHHALIAPEIRPFKVARKFSINLDKFLKQRSKFMYDQAELEIEKNARRVLRTQAAHMNQAAEGGMDFVGEQDIVEYFTARMQNREIQDLRGEPVKILSIRDTKSGKKTPNEDAAHESSQLTAYSLASKVLDGKIPNAVGLDYLVDLKGGVKPAILKSTRNVDDIDHYLTRLAHSIATIRSGMFVPAPDTAWWCDQRYCGFWKECPYARGRGRKDVSFPEDLTGTIEKSLVMIQGGKQP